MEVSAYILKIISRCRMPACVLICGLVLFLCKSASASTMNDIASRQKEIVDKFNRQEQWMDKMQLLIDMGNDNESFDEKYKINSNIIEGCSTRVWMFVEKKNGKLHYYGYTDALVLNGVLSVLFYVFNDSSPHEVLNASFEFFDRIGIKEYLSPTRSNDVNIIIAKFLSVANSNL